MKLVFLLLLSIIATIGEQKFKFQTHHTSKFKNKNHLSQKYKAAHQMRHRSHKYLNKYANAKSRIQTESRQDDERTVQQIIFGLNMTDVDTSIDMTQEITASPAEVNDEIDKRAVMTNDEIINNRFENAWDLRPQDFSCASDEMSGNFFMIDKVTKSTPDLNEKFVENVTVSTNVVSLQKYIHLANVIIQVNEYKLAIYDTKNVLKDIIYFENVYPSNADLKTKMQKSADYNGKGKREILESTKLKVMNATRYANDINMSVKEFYCVTLMNDAKGTNEYLNQYNKLQGILQKTLLIGEQKQDNTDNDPFRTVMNDLFQFDDSNSASQGMKNLHKNTYYDMLTLCHPNYQTINKLNIFMNREKYDCWYEYNAKNMGIRVKTESTMVKSTTTSNEYREQLRLKYQQDEMRRQAMEEEKKRQREQTQMTEQELQQEELERLQSELTELTQTMDQEQQFSESEINGMVTSIQTVQEQLGNKNDQLKCLEQALEIKQEEENEQVIRLLKDEEMSKIKSVVKTARSKMKQSYKKRISELKKSLEEQKAKINREKDSFDQVMINLIRTDLKNGKSSNCMPVGIDPASPEKLSEFMEKACGNVLDDTSNAFDLQGGTLDVINKCTKKDFFCSVCCSYEFGSEKLVERNNCESGCANEMQKFQLGKKEFGADLINVVQKDAYNEMSKKMETEQEKMKELARIKMSTDETGATQARFKEIVKKSRSKTRK